MWVDDSDPVWRAEKDAWQKAEADSWELVADGVQKARWRDNDELKYSLRSVSRFAPWINHIYLVTGFGQAPDWLDTSNPKITVVDHRDIMPADSLPTFNSMAIESCIVNIPGLSDRFLLANDDTFFGAPIEPSYFYDSRGRTIVWHNRVKMDLYKDSTDKCYYEYITMFLHNAAVFKDAFGVSFKNITPCHNIEPYVKSRICELISNPKIRPWIDKTTRSKFRKTFDISRWMFSWYDIMNKNAVMRRIRAPKSSRHFICNIWYLWTRAFKRSPQYTTNAKHKKLDHIKPYLFCVNDTAHSTDATRQSNREFLKAYFPNKSEFEK
jgi:hypothetical protein